MALALATGMVLFGSATLLARLVSQELPPLVGSALRVVLAVALLLPVAHLRGFRSSRLARADWLRAAPLAVVGMFGFTIMLGNGIQRVSRATMARYAHVTVAQQRNAAALLDED